jgi:PBSX family phage terminase large subunit
LKDYIKSKAKGILSFHFELEDNNFLDERYIREIKETTPRGMFYDRGIKGLWVSGEGVVYPQFDRKLHTITKAEAAKINFDRYFCGVDWGWEHWGALVLVGVRGKDYYILEEHASQHLHINSWIGIAKDIVTTYGNIPFYCDPARPEHIAAFQEAGLRAFPGNNRVLSGIEAVATLMQNGLFHIVYDHCPRFRDEIYKYVWKKNTGEPLKENDDVLCAIRYGVYSDMTVNSQDTAKERLDKAKRIKRMI